MSGSRGNSRRRRSGSTSRRYKPAELVPIQPRRRSAVGTTEIAASIGVALVAVAIIVLIWVVTYRNINDQTASVRDRAERMVAAQAATLAEEVRHELLLVDQSLTVLQAEWAKDQEHFDLTKWQKLTPALTSVANDLFIADERRIVRQDILPQAVGQGVGGAYLNFPHGALELLGSDGKQAGRLVIAESGEAIQARRYLMYIIRPLATPKDWLIGASFRSEELTKLYGQVALGINGVVALMDTKRGTLQAVAGPAARHPQVDVSKSPMLAAFNAKPAGNWTGPTAMDNTPRIHGFAKIEGRDMVVTVGLNQTEVMVAAESLTSGAWWVAFTGSALVVGVGGLILWEIYNLRANGRRQRNYERAQSDLESLQSEASNLRARSVTSAAQVALLLRVSNDGVPLLDADLRFVGWNERFAAACGLAPEDLKEGMMVDDFMRHQAQEGLIGPFDSDDPEAAEAEIAKRVALLRTEPAGAILPQLDGAGGQIAICADVIADGGGLIFVIGGSEL